jgi:DNA-binding MarR family transcriptional regulator
MLSDQMQRLLASYPKIYLACHRRHLRGDERRLTEHQASILHHLHIERPTAISDLARHLDVTEATMSLNISRLQRAGYLHRVRQSDDARRVGVRLSPAGAKARQENSVLDPDLLRELIAQLAPADLEPALYGLDLLAGAAERLMQKRALRRKRAKA